MKGSNIYLFILQASFLIACSNVSQKEINKQQKNQVKSVPTSAASANAPVSDCDDGLWKYVYDPDRLQVLEKCKTVTGIIEESNADPDGDQHMLLKLDKGQKDLLTKKNKKKKNGDLVIEVVCANHISRKRALGACTGYQNQIVLPSVGEHVRVSGTYVLDSHNGWTEIHPVSRIGKIE